MKLFDILKKRGLFSNDIKDRVKNKQITVNSEIITENVFFDDYTILDPGDFLVDLIKEHPEFIPQLKFFGLEGLIGSNIENELTETLKKFIFIKFSKKESLMLKKNHFRVHLHNRLKEFQTDLEIDDIEII